MERELQIPTLVSTHTNQLDSESYKKAKQNNKNKIKKITMSYKKALISGTLILSAGVAIGNAAAATIKDARSGAIICNEFYKATSNFSTYEGYNTGFNIVQDGVVVDFEDGKKAMIQAARNAGMEDVEIYYALNTHFGRDVCSDYLGEFSGEEIDNAKEKAYLEHELEEVNEEKKGATK